MSTPTAYDLRRRILGTSDYRTPAPLVRPPLTVFPKVHLDDFTALYAELDAAYDTQDAIEDRAIDSANDPTDERAWRKRRDEMAARIAEGDTTANVADVLPTFDPAQALAAYEVLLVALKAARTNTAAMVRKVNAKIAEIAPDLIPPAAKVAATLEAKAVADEALAAASRSKANAAAETARNLRLPEAVAAYRAAGLDIAKEGFTAVWRATRLINGPALLSAVEGWSDDPENYYSPEIAPHLGIVLKPKAAPLTQEQKDAQHRIKAARGDFADGTVQSWSTPSSERHLR